MSKLQQIRINHDTDLVWILGPEGEIFFWTKLHNIRISPNKTCSLVLKQVGDEYVVQWTVKCVILLYLAERYMRNTNSQGGIYVFS